MAFTHVVPLCWCADECPPLTRPWYKYFVVIEDHHLVEYQAGIIYEHILQTGNTCLWQPMPDQFDPPEGQAHEMIKNSIFFPFPFDNGYTILLTIQNAEPGNQWGAEFVWNDEPPGPPLPVCDVGWQLPSLIEPFASPAKLFPIPIWACPGFTPII